MESNSNLSVLSVVNTFNFSHFVKFYLNILGEDGKFKGIIFGLCTNANAV